MSGISKQLFSSLFDGINERVARDPTLHVSVTVSYAELYNEHLKDLLGAGLGAKNMVIRESSAGGVHVKGLTEHSCTSLDVSFLCRRL